MPLPNSGQIEAISLAFLAPRRKHAIGLRQLTESRRLVS